MNNQQKFLLKLLKEIHSICERNDIQYFLAGGTLIGAIRHGGFLPWDDDADLYMTRENWNRFVEACKTELPANRVLQGPDIDLSYNNTFPRYVATDSTAIHSHQVLGGMPAGEVIDILVLDPIPDDDGVLERYTYDLMLYSDLLNYAAVFGRRFGVKASDYKKYSRLKKKYGERWIRDHFENRLASYLSEEGSRYAMRWGGNPLLFERKWFSQAVPCRYEDFVSYKPIGSSEYLTYHYGDEWTTVPTNAEHASHETASLLGVSREVALERYVPKIDPKKLLKRMSKRKVNVLKNAEESLRLQTELLEIQGRKYEMELLQKLKANELEYSHALESSDYAVLSDLFADYFAWQFSAEVIGRDDWKGIYRFNHPVIAALDNEVFSIGIETLLNTERVGKAFRLLQALGQAGRDTAIFEPFGSVISRFRKATSLYQEKKFLESLILTEELLGVYPGNVSFNKLKVLALYSLIESGEDRNESLEKTIAWGLAEYPNDGFFVKYHADYLSMSGSAVAKDEIERMYIEAADSTANGIVLLDIKEKVGYEPDWMKAYYIEERSIFDWNADETDDRTDDNGDTDEPEGADCVEESPESSPLSPELLLTDMPDPCDTETPEQRYLFNLLCELVNICEMNSIRYCLSPRAVISFFYQGVLPNGLSDYSIYLTSQEFGKLLDVLGRMEMPNREFESMINSVRYPRCTIRYIGRDSLYLNAKDGLNYRHHGLFVSARLLAPERYTKLTGSLYTGWKKTCYRFNKMYKPKQVVSASAVGLLSLLFGRKRTAGYILKRCMRESLYASGNFRISCRRKTLLYPVDTFVDPSELEFENVRFRVPRNIEEYARTALMKTRACNKLPMRFDKDAIYSTIVSYSAFLGSVGLTEEYYKRRRRMFLKNAYASLVRRQFRREFGRIKNAVAIKGYEIEYTNNKEKLIELSKNGEYDRLNAIFRPFLALLKAYPPARGVVFDEDVVGCIVETLSASKREKMLKLTGYHSI